MQSAVDAAALSGAKYLPCQVTGTGANNATSTATTIAEADFLQTSELSGQPTFSNTGTAPTCQGGAAGDNTIMVRVTRTVPFHFGRVIGVNQGTVSVCAKAEVGGVSGDVHPILWVGQQACGASYPSCPTPYTVGETMGLTGGKGTSGWLDAPGDWGALRPGQPLNIGSTVTPNPGNGNGNGSTTCGEKCILNDAQNLINEAMSNPAYSGDTATNFVAGDPRLVVVPLVDWSACSSGGSSCQPTVEGFAQYFINSVTPENGSRDGTINATFIGDGIPGTFSTSVQCTGGAGSQDVGACAIKLFDC
jgi:hypothetical protein